MSSIQLRSHFLCWLFGFMWIACPVQPQISGGSDASGGGDGLETQILEGKFLAIEALTLYNEEALRTQHIDPASIQFFMSIAPSLLDDMKRSEFRIFKKDPQQDGYLVDETGNRLNRQQFYIDGLEKTFITTHRPMALIQINFHRCIELNIGLAEIAVLFTRESARHLGIQDDLVLRNNIEKIAMVLVNERLRDPYHITSSSGTVIPAKSEIQNKPSDKANPDLTAGSRPEIFPITMSIIPEGEYGYDGYYQNQKKHYLYTYEISDLITAEQYVSFLKSYDALFPDQFSNTMQALDAYGHPLTLPLIYKNGQADHPQISYETSIEHFNNRGSWIGIPLSPILNLFSSRKIRLRYDPDAHSPVAFITWYGASEFCQYYGFDLPTEFQWQKAKTLGIIQPNSQNGRYSEWTSTKGYDHFSRETQALTPYENPLGPSFGSKYVMINFTGSYLENADPNSTRDVAFRCVKLAQH